MKKIKYLVLIFMTMVMLPVNVHAFNGSVSVTCSPSEAKPGNTVSCKITGTSDDVVNTFKATMTFGTGLIFDSFSVASGWQGDGDDNNLISLFGAEKSGTFDIGTINVKVGDDSPNGQVNVGIINIDVTSNRTHYTLDNATGSFNVSASEPVVSKGLKSLSVDAAIGTLSPSFDSNQTGYALNLNSADMNNFSIRYEAANPSDSVTVKNGDTDEVLDANNITFKTETDGGNSDMLIWVIVGSGENQVIYAISVRKPASPLIAAAELSSLVVGGKSVSLVSGTTEYSVQLDDVNSYEIVATLKDSTNYEFNSGTVVLLTPYKLSKEGTYEIRIDPRNNSSGLSTVTYLITVTKKRDITPEPSSSQKPSNPGNVYTNPSTGGTAASIMGIVLILSLFASLYLYKRNMSNFS